jgi:phosphate-selective porin
MTRAWVLRTAVCAVALLGTAAATAADNAPLTFESADFSLKIGATVQLEATHLTGDYQYSGSYFTYPGDEAPIPFANTELESRNDFRVRRARVNFSGHALLPYLNYVFEVDGGQEPRPPGPYLDTTSDGPRVTDAYVALNFSDAVNLRAGQFKVPFDLFWLINGRYQMFVERPSGSDLFAPRRDVGLMYSGSALERRASWHLALMNGSGANQSGNDNSKYLLAARAEFQNAGGFKYRETAADHPESLEWTVGASYLDNPRNQGDAVPTDETGLSCLPGVSSRCEMRTDKVQAMEIFGALRGRRFQVNATWQKWGFDNQALDNIDPFVAAPTKLDITYYNLDAGFFVTDNIEIAARYGQWKHDKTLYFWNGEDWSDTLQTEDPLNITFIGATDVKRTEWRLGVNYYLSGHNAKVMLDYGQEVEQVDKSDPGEFGFGTGRAKFTVKGLRAMLAFFM